MPVRNFSGDQRASSLLLPRVAAALLEIEERTGLPRERFIEKCGVAGAFYYDLITCRANPSLLVLENIAKRLQVPVERLLGLGRARKRSESNGSGLAQYVPRRGRSRTALTA